MDSTGLTVVIVTVVGTLLLCGVIVWFMFANMKKQAYKGIVVKKTSKELEDAQDNSYTSYALIIKTDDGKEKAIRVGNKIWDQFKVGDRIIKEAGKYNPTKG